MNQPEPIFLKDYTPPCFFIDLTDLIFEIHDDHTKVISSLKIRKNKDISDETTPLILDKGKFSITSVVADGMLLLTEEYETGDDFLKIIRTPDLFELEITNVLKPRENTSLEGLYRSGNILCTQCESQGFRKITPYIDRPDMMSVFSCTISADPSAYPVLLSNGNLVRQGSLEGNRHYARWEDPFKKPSYLFALVAGDLDHIKDQFKTGSGRMVDLKIYSEKENIDQCSHAMKSLKESMAWDEKRFGLEYDLDLYQIVAINDFNAGAMENKGLNIFNSKYVLADPKTATDDDFMNVQSVIGHEYFHNWTGNRVTLKNWFQLSLKEGLTVFRDQEFSSDLNSRAVKRIADVRDLRIFQFPEDSGPMVHPVRPESYIKMDNFYTMTVYKKGAEIIRMIHQILGEKKFQKGMALYFEKFDGMAVTIEDFVSAMQEASGIDLDQFRLWYSQSGTPHVAVKRTYHEDTRELELKFTQETRPDRNQDVKIPFHIPVGFNILDARGKDILDVSQSLLELKKGKETFIFKNIEKGRVPSVFRKFSAPVRVETDLNDEELAFLMANDSDEFNRWDSAQTLFLKEIKRLVKNTDRKIQVSTELITAFKKAMNDETADRSFLSKLLFLPVENEIKEHFDLVDVDAIHTARQGLKKGIAAALKNDFLIMTEKCSHSDPFSLEPDAMADRSLKNLSLSYLGSLNEKETNHLIEGQYKSAKNMTDELACFSILADINETLKAKAADRFYSRWRKNKLVLDKWFSVQAGSALPDTLKQVSGLLSHPDFSIKNPNKVRSLIHMFAMNNAVNFHEKSGRSYSFIADRILELDSINPQGAARLSACFNHWKKYDSQRKALMKKELERIISAEGLSRNVYEIVSRALDSST